jgi:hypothetical protein
VPDREVQDKERPVIAGLVALVGVGLAVGLIAGLAALVGVQVLGVGNAGASGEATGVQSLYLPTPKPTKAASGPLITLAPEPSQGGNAGGGGGGPKAEETDKPGKKKEKEITLSASQTSISAMQQLDLTGVYPGGEGAILQVQRFTDGSWTDFPVTVPVSDETFATYVQTSQAGPNRFRVVDTESGLKSNEVKVTVN